MLAAEWLTARLQRHHTLHDAGAIYTELDLSDASFRRRRFDATAGAFHDSEGRLPAWLVLYRSPLYTYTQMPAQLQTLSQIEYRPERSR